MWPTRIVLGVVAAMLLVLPGWAKPALWVVRSPTATLYLFGTIHALKPGITPERVQ